MRLPENLLPATFVSRPNRFTATVRLQQGEVLAHVANSGRLRELFQPGQPVLLAPRQGEHRKTAFDLTLVKLPQGLVSADARIPNALVHEAFLEGRLLPFSQFTTARREVRYGHSRLDLLLSGKGADCIIEVKSVTLVEDGRALFPDAPTERGRRHLGELAHPVGQGTRAAVVFVIQRADATGFSPHDKADPDFARVLRDVHRAGVEVYAYRCRVTAEEIAITDPVPLIL